MRLVGNLTGFLRSVIGQVLLVIGGLVLGIFVSNATFPDNPLETGAFEKGWATIHILPWPLYVVIAGAAIVGGIVLVILDSSSR